MSDCPHETFNSKLVLHKFVPTEGGAPYFLAEVSVSCGDCGEPFRFLGPYPAGMSAEYATVNDPGTLLHAPMAPGEDPRYKALKTSERRGGLRVLPGGGESP